MHLEIRHLRLVAAIADAGGVTRAAQRLHLTQSALSHQLKDIETRLGSALFLRSGRQMLLTSAGQRVLESARRVIAEVERAEADILATREDGAAGLMRIATECYTCYHWLPPVLADFRKRWPRVEVRIVPQATRRPLAALAGGELDLALVAYSTDETAPGSTRTTYTPIFEDELVVVVAPDHPLARKKFATAADFADEHLLLYNVPDDELSILRDVLRPAGVSPRSVSRVELTEAIVELVKGGLGVGVLARWAVAPQVAAGSVVTVPLTKGGMRRRWYAATRAAATPSPYMGDFIARLAQDAFPAQLPPNRSPRRRPTSRGPAARRARRTRRSSRDAA